LRQRKDNAGGKSYSLFMLNDDSAFIETSVDNLLKSSPKVVRFFIDQHTSCAGCYLARFCSLKDVIHSYKLDEKKFLMELSRITIQKS